MAMLYLWYLLGAASCVTGLLIIGTALRAYPSEVRAGRSREGRRLLELSLPRGLGVLLTGVQVILIGYFDRAQIPWWPGIAGVILLAVSHIDGLVRGRLKTG